MFSNAFEASDGWCDDIMGEWSNDTKLMLDRVIGGSGKAGIDHIRQTDGVRCLALQFFRGCRVVQACFSESLPAFWFVRDHGWVQHRVRGDGGEREGLQVCRVVTNVATDA